MLPEALVLEGPFDLRTLAAVGPGAVSPQSRAAMLVARALAPQPGERVLDLCAAPGGKATHLAALMRGRGEVVAVERHRRAGRGAARAPRGACAPRNVRVEVPTRRSRAPKGRFDRVLVDPPCSGLGTLAGPPRPALADDAGGHRRARRAAGPRSSPRRAAVTAPGGTLVYATCTISAQENEAVIAKLMRSNPGFAVDDLRADFPAWHHPQAAEYLLTLPSRDRTAGFFVARLRRRP